MAAYQQGHQPWSRQAGPVITSGSVDKEDIAASVLVAYTCPHAHAQNVRFSANVDVPQEWTCRHCGQPSHRDGQDAATQIEQPGLRAGTKTHMDMVRERRTDEDLAAILNERLEVLRSRKKRGH